VVETESAAVDVRDVTFKSTEKVNVEKRKHEHNASKRALK
jgi:hypothetical protein